MTGCCGRLLAVHYPFSPRGRSIWHLGAAYSVRVQDLTIVHDCIRSDGGSRGRVEKTELPRHRTTHVAKKRERNPDLLGPSGRLGRIICAYAQNLDILTAVLGQLPLERSQPLPSELGPGTFIKYEDDGTCTRRLVKRDHCP
jgi:hypothetical protein